MQGEGRRSSYCAAAQATAVHWTITLEKRWRGEGGEERKDTEMEGDGGTKDERVYSTMHCSGRMTALHSGERWMEEGKTG